MYESHVPAKWAPVRRQGHAPSMNLPMHAVIIAGGLGTRAHAMTGDRIPKALLPVAGVPIVFRQMRVLRRLVPAGQFRPFP